jgi:Zn2+/Cd2+-exporting ATPase
MDCPSCLVKIQGRLRQVEGVAAVEGNPVTRVLTLALDPLRGDGEQVRRALEDLGYGSEPVAAGVRPARPADVWRSRSATLAYASAALFALGLLSGVDHLLVAAALVGGWNFFPKGARAARSGVLDMNVLMSVAIVGALLIGEYVEAASIAFLFALAELLEGYSVDRARASVEALLELAPDVALLERDGDEVTVAVEALVAGDVVRVRPGDRVPADAIVLEGWSAVDQSPVTGESLPVDKRPGDELFSGTVNRDGFLRARVVRAAAESTLARIVRLVEEAELGRSRTERFVERFARVYTPAVVVAALLVVAVPFLVLGLPFAVWFERGLTLLVIACPCALVISTPVAVVSGVTAAARHGVLIKGGRHLEGMGEVRVLALDKTGTLTLGQLEVVEVTAASRSIGAGAFLALASAVERRSEHPVAKAVVAHARALGVLDADAPVSDFRATPGVGVQARVGERRVRVGRAVADGPPADSAGRTVVEVDVDGRVEGWITLADRGRPDAVAAVAALRAMGLHTVMLTGDHPSVADEMGHRLGVDEVWGGLLPADKVARVQALEAERGPVAMVGDGINDAPALATARVGIAMGAAASDVALETADIALMGDELGGLPYLVTLSRRARSVIRQNIAAAIAVKAVLALGVPFGAVSLITAVVVGDMGVSLAVIGNALRLARVRPATATRPAPPDQYRANTRVAPSRAKASTS